jgi:predicted  nucleic acid-binding Zn-ribbon protein
VSRREQVEAVLQDVLPRLEEIKADALAEIDRIRKDATQKASRYEQAREELEGVEARLVMLEAEKEGLPVEHSRALLEDNVDEELRIKERFTAVTEEIERLEDRRASLKEEIHRLLPNTRGHRNDVRIEAASRVAGAAFEEREALEDLKERLTKALDDAIDPVATVHEQSRGLTQSLGQERSWELSPVGKGAVR